MADILNGGIKNETQKYSSSDVAKRGRGFGGDSDFFGASNPVGDGRNPRTSRNQQNLKIDLYLKWKVRSGMGSMAALLIRAALVAATVTLLTAPLTFGFNGDNMLCWNKPTTPVDGYILSFGTGAAGSYPIVKDVVASAVIEGGRCGTGSVGVTLGSLGLPDHPTYRAVAQAYDEGGLSDYSAEAVPSPFPLDQTPPDVPGGLSVK